MLIQLPQLSIHPVETGYTEARDLATDTDRFNLTGVVELNAADADLLFDLTAALTFCQQQWVILANGIEREPGQALAQLIGGYPSRLDVPFSRPTQGAQVMSDSFEPASRRMFLEQCLARLSDHQFDHDTQFRSAFFRCVESWRLLQPFVDLTYYLDFGALEILARTAQQDFRAQVAPPITAFLQGLGFGVSQDNPGDRVRAVQTYVHLRNALFHNGRFEKTFNENGNDVTIQLNDYEGYLRRLVPDVLLKVMGFDDSHINWERWLDRQPFC